MPKLYDLAGAEEDRRFSPYCWRIKMALAHKGIEPETVPWRFTDKEAIEFSGQTRVPVLVDGENVVSDSWRIANYLEDRFSDRPSLFGGPGGRGAARFIASWADTVLQPAIARLIVADIHAHLHERDRKYFRATREKALGGSLEEICADRDDRVVKFRETDLRPLRATLTEQPYLGGESPTYADYSVFGGFQWARAVSVFRLLADGDPIAEWRHRMLELHGRLAGKAPGYAV
ncbi:glutathione S-transferase family protein [Bradyrhizobium sp. CB82]|uniref:glutathione S-transferase family protein n=1 Tax=Bradyrhizobium sp. CB82 TaxID=3039159 RepID=UPI0024B086A7|nr:glutathione S-transferase family protein [Bradyrhizobium sp. CB82]WFU39082.1 glutathione S-transferase family protein [Bradyrhizobium sp. CB82]